MQGTDASPTRAEAPVSSADADRQPPPPRPGTPITAAPISAGPIPDPRQPDPPDLRPPPITPLRSPGTVPKTGGHRPSKAGHSPTDCPITDVHPSQISPAPYSTYPSASSSRINSGSIGPSAPAPRVSARNTCWSCSSRASRSMRWARSGSSSRRSRCW
jgi:hypothetical protein